MERRAHSGIGATWGSWCYHPFLTEGWLAGSSNNDLVTSCFEFDAKPKHKCKSLITMARCSVCVREMDKIGFNKRKWNRHLFNTCAEYRPIKCISCLDLKRKAEDLNLLPHDKAMPQKVRTLSLWTKQDVQKWMEDNLEMQEKYDTQAKEQELNRKFLAWIRYETWTSCLP